MSPQKQLLVVFGRVFEYIPGILSEARLVTFVSKIDFEGPNGCWLWKGFRNPDGYGSFYHDGGNVPAHRLCYKVFVGNLPDSLHAHHVTEDPVCCVGAACINPWHIEPVTPILHAKERTPKNITARNAQKTHCPRGHKLTRYVYPSGRVRRKCQTCIADAIRAKRARFRAANPLLPKTHCKRGHEYTPENTYIDRKGKRSCKRCRSLRMQAFLRRNPGYREQFNAGRRKPRAGGAEDAR